MPKSGIPEQGTIYNVRNRKDLPIYLLNLTQPLPNVQNAVCASLFAHCTAKPKMKTMWPGASWPCWMPLGINIFDQPEGGLKTP